MNTTHNRSIVRSSERNPVHGARAVGLVSDDERFGVTVRIRRKTPLHSSMASGYHDDRKPGQRRYLNRNEYVADHGADLADMTKVEEFAQAHGLVVVESNRARRSVFLSGTAADFAAAFVTTIEHYELLKSMENLPVLQ